MPRYDAAVTTRRPLDRPTLFAFGLVALLAVAQIAYPQVPADLIPAATAATVLIFLAASVVAGALRLGLVPSISLAGIAIVLGYASEVLGTRTGFPFSPYSYTDVLQPQLLDVPILIPLAWGMMAFPAWRVGELLADGWIPRAILAALALTAWDVALDPQMVGLGFWSWPEGGAYAGIPLQNFVGWFLVGLLVFGLWSLLTRRNAPPTPNRAVDLLGPILYAWTWIGETIAHLLFFDGVGVAVASFVAMGIFALPALARVLRPSAS